MATNRGYNRMTIREREQARRVEDKRRFGVTTYRCRHCKFQVAEKDLKKHLTERCPNRPPESQRGGMPIEAHYEPVVR